MRVINESRVDFQYKLHPKGHIVTKTTFSNIVSTIIVDTILVVKKIVNKNNASIYDILTYTIEIQNISNKQVNNLRVEDILPEGTKFVNNSLKINNVYYSCANIESGVFLGSIGSNVTIVLSFDVVINEIDVIASLINFCVVTFDYIYNVEESPTLISMYSNEVWTKCEDNLFKQIIIKDKIKIPVCYGFWDYVIGVDSGIKIIHKKIVRSYIKSDMDEVIVVGCIVYKVYYAFKGRIQAFISSRGFSTSLMVPKGIEYFDEVNITPYKEKTVFSVVGKTSMFVTTAILLKIENK